MEMIVEESLVEDVMKYLARRRLCSLGNLSRYFELKLENVFEMAQLLQDAGRIRLVTSSCFGKCSDCGGCDKAGSGSSTLSDATVAISLEVDVNTGEAEE